MFYDSKSERIHRFVIKCILLDLKWVIKVKNSSIIFKTHVLNEEKCLEICRSSTRWIYVKYFNIVQSLSKPDFNWMNDFCGPAKTCSVTEQCQGWVTISGATESWQRSRELKSKKLTFYLETSEPCIDLSGKQKRKNYFRIHTRKVVFSSHSRLNTRVVTFTLTSTCFSLHGLL